MNSFEGVLAQLLISFENHDPSKKETSFRVKNDNKISGRCKK